MKDSRLVNSIEYPRGRTQSAHYKTAILAHPAMENPKEITVERLLLSILF